MNLRRDLWWMLIVVALLALALRGAWFLGHWPVTPCPTATPDSRWDVMETRLVNADNEARYLQQTAIALETACAPTPEPSPTWMGETPTPTIVVTPTQWPTPEPTTTPYGSGITLCHTCSPASLPCAPGLTCKYCDQDSRFHCVPAGGCNACLGTGVLQDVGESQEVPTLTGMVTVPQEQAVLP